MTTSNEITLDHIKNFFSLTEEIRSINIAPTATGGAGIDNIQQFPPPRPTISVDKDKNTNYVKKYLDMAHLEEEKKKSVNVVTGSTYSINGIEDVDDLSTLADIPEYDELQTNEVAEEIYKTYYPNKDIIYNSDLNVTNYREEILHQLDISPVLIIEGPTGCGKTTQVPQYILDYHAAKKRHCNIIVTQPRKIAAISIAKRVCQERNWSLGTLVGYQVAMDPKVSADTRLSYVTTGVLLEKLVAEKNMNKYTHVIIDEVHERDQDIDFALLLVKKFLLTNSRKVKVVLMSATFDTSVFAKYFSLSCSGDLAPIIEISGKSKEVTEHYLHELKTLIPVMPEFEISDPCIDPRLYDAVVRLLDVFDNIEKKEQGVPLSQEYAPSRGAVLIFLPGYDEISLLSDRLMAARFNKKYWVIPLHSMITLSEQNKVFIAPPVNHRKVIISTNIAESSITVPDVKYVIDFCLTKNLTTDPLTNYICLKLEWASKANCTQRKGRTGRVSIGKVYRMVPKQFYERFPDYSTPEIKRCPLTSTILHVKKLNVCEPEEMLAFALDPPYSIDIENAILQLKEALALYGKGSYHDGELTFIGDVMASLPLDVKLSKLILLGYAFSCLEECIIIAASLSLQSFFARPFQKALESYRSRLSWAHNSFSDCLVYLNAYKVWKRHSSQSLFLKPGGMTEKEWGDRHYIQIRRIKEVDMLVKELKSRLEKHNIFVDSHHSNREDDPKSNLILKVVLAGAFFPHYFLQQNLDEKDVLRDVNENDPLNTVVVQGLPPNHGLLYSSTLSHMFQAIDKVDIEFEERKAFIKFQRSNDLFAHKEDRMPSQSVVPAVYLAVKMRMLQMPLELAVFSHEEAESKMKQMVQLKRATSERVLATNRFIYKDNPEATFKRIPLPSPDLSIIQIFISHVHSCSSFWARYITAASSEHLRFLELSLCNYEKNKGFRPLQAPPRVNLLYLAPYQDSRNGPVGYYRAQVQHVENRKAKVHFVDYGNEEVIDIRDLREIGDDLSYLKDTPALAFECCLAEIKPSSRQFQPGKWSPEAIKWFKRAVNGVSLHAKVYSVVQDTVRVELLKPVSNGVQIINEELVTRGFAEKFEENLQSKQNHEYREKCIAYSAGNTKPVEDAFSPIEFSSKDTLQFSTLKLSGSKIRLKGPFSPLETSYSGLTNIDRCKSIKVERDSVNSVSLNPDPQDPHPSMLIASNLTIGQRSDVVMLRNTTLMPKILGLPSLLLLVFAPYAEIRIDKERKSYTGALCGLGYDAATGEPLYQDHDTEIEFDIEITVNDICDINAIRMGMNMLLQSKDESKAKVAKCKSVLRDCIVKLLQSERLPKEPHIFHQSSQWNQVPSVLLLNPSVDETADNPHVFPLHKPPGLRINNPEIFHNG